MDARLRRYTELPFLIDLLQSKQLKLLSTSTWDDRNDSFFIEQYAAAKNLSRTYALCLTESDETYHHWRVFSHGSGGVCIDFDKQRLLKALKKYPQLQARAVEYKKINDISNKSLLTDALPFTKRIAFKDENEFRLFYACNEGEATLNFPIPLNTIKRITLSPWLPKTVANQVKATLKAIDGCKSLSIYRSTLVENERWKRLAAPKT